MTTTGSSPFDPAMIDAETASFNAELEAILAKEPLVHTQPYEVTRRLRELGQSRTGPVILSKMAEERTILGPDGDLVLRTFVPDVVKGVYLHIHGGGWVLGVLTSRTHGSKRSPMAAV